jgi:hypothetical protein
VNEEGERSSAPFLSSPRPLGHKWVYSSAVCCKRRRNPVRSAPSGVDPIVSYTASLPAPSVGDVSPAPEPVPR